MSVLVALGTSAAYGYALIAIVLSMAKSSVELVRSFAGGCDWWLTLVFALQGNYQFFETASTLITFIILGRQKHVPRELA